MLRLLLDAHVSPVVAEQVRVWRPACDIVSLQEWRAGQYLRAPDPVLLEAAQEGRRTVVSYDQGTIPDLLELWGAHGVEHSGVILVSGRTIRSSDVGALVRSVIRVWDMYGEDDWTNRMAYLERID